jgi:hypothetical protein
LRATTWSIVGTLFALFGHWVCTGMCCFFPLLAALSVRERNLEWLRDLELGLTPPFVFGALPYREVSDLEWRREPQLVSLVVLAQVGWVIGALVVGHLAHEKFRRLTNRLDWSADRWENPRPVESLPMVLPAEDES